MLKAPKKHDVANLFGKRILVLVPHPDDETVAFAASIMRARKKETEVFALVLSNGCVDIEAIAPRHRAAHAARITQRKEEFYDVVECLGFKVLAYHDRPTRTLHMHLKEIWQEVRKTVDQYAIDQVWVPAYEGGHGDHDAINGVASPLLKEMSVLEFSAYHFADKKPVTNAFIIPSGNDQVVLLTAEERMLKKVCLGIYQSEKQNLRYFNTVQEMFRPLPIYNYRKVPHALPLWYTRHQWVPRLFDRPDINRTKPEEISYAIDKFLKSMNTAK